MKRIFSVLLALCLTISLVGCASSTSQQTPATPDSSSMSVSSVAPTGNIELNWWWFPLWKGMDGQADQQADVWPKEIARQYIESHPEVSKINIELLTWDKGIQKLDTAVAAGAAPDLCYLDLSWLPKYYAQDVIVTAEDYFDEGDKADFYESGAEFASYDGKMQAWPLLIAPRVLYANKTLLTEMGLADKLPLDGGRSWTVDDFTEIAKAFPYEKEGKNVYAFECATGAAAPSYLLWLWNHGAQIYNDDETKFLLNSPETLKGAEYLMSMINGGHFRYAPEGAQKANFWAGDVAFIEGVAYTEANVIDRVKKATAEGKEAPEMVSVQFPVAQGVTNAKTYSGIGGMVVFKQKKDSPERIAAATGLAKFITSTENGKAVKAGGTFPTRRSSGDVYGDDANAKVAQSMLPYGEDLGRQENSNKIYQNVVIPGFDSMFVGVTTPKETLENMEKEAAAILK